MKLVTLFVGSAILLAHQASAGYESNLAYRSPYKNRPELAIDVPRLRKRQQGARGQSTQIVAPGAGGRQKSSNYLLYGDAAVNWTASDYIYAGSVNFTHGVASGDPFDNSVLVWTRAYPTGVATRDVPICVTYEVNDAVNMTGNKVAGGFAYTSFDVDNTVKVEVTGLKASTYYWYQWANCAHPNETSIIGRTKTAPGKDATDVGPQRFAVYSCSNFPNGFFNSYGGPVYNADTDYVLHLGDYIYETGSNTTGAKINRTVVPQKDIFSILDYRQRYANYRTDPDLLLSHQMLPWIAVWDDHETANNIWKAGTDNSNDTVQGCSITAGVGICFTEREANAKRAYHEWIPIREVDVSDEKRIWRDFRFGDLVDIVALDTRHYERDVTDNTYNTEYVSDVAIALNTSRSLTGEVQEQWLYDTIDSSIERGTKWRLVMNQIVFGTIDERYTSADPTTSDFPLDSYDKDWKNVVLVSGDSHSNWLFENNLDNVLVGSKDPSTLTPSKNAGGGDYRRGQLVEFGGTAVSSSGYGASFLTEANSTAIAAKGLVANSAGLLWTEGFYRGYMGVVVSASNITTTYWAYPDNQIKRSSDRRLSAKFTVLSGKNALQRPLNATYGALKG